ncbi:MAG TPA: ATP-binding protein [Candidatus Thermoplasmatota archaeon]|nr:ATP-binding protein [Candidatus Thermoplasmatota archaeon]
MVFESPPEEVHVLPPDAALLGDLVALTFLPATWVGWSTDRVAPSLAEAVARLVSGGIVHVSLRDPGEANAFSEALRHGPREPKPGGAFFEAVTEVRRVAPLLQPFRLENAGAGVPTHWFVCPVGSLASEGTIIVASWQEGVPTARERLLLSVAANQTAIILRNASLDRELLAARRELAQTEKLSSLGQLVAGVAHEVRTPLTYSTNYLRAARSRLARMDDGPDALNAQEALKAVDGALEGLNRINTLVGNLRRFTQIPPGRRVRTSFSTLVGQAVDLFSAADRGRGLLRRDLRAISEVDVDRIQIQQVVLNLVENAADAMPGGGAIIISTFDTPHGVELRVQDQGPGIPKEVQGRVFDPFFTTKPQGSGLGLSIVRRIVEAHGGHITFTSAPGEGTTFIVAFPASGSEMG